MEKSLEKLETEERENVANSKTVKKGKATVVELTKVALMTALFCILAPHTILLPVSPVGITLGSFLVYLTGFLLGPRLGSMSVLLYLLLGLVGLPVFSGYMGGVAKLFGPTGGYLIGFLPCAWIVGALTKKGGRGKWAVVRFILAAVLGTAVLYAFGTVWFLLVYTKGITLSDALSKCVIPFLPLDSVKIVVAAVLSVALQRIRGVASIK
ncbi:MAG: biotin transporter BioY [Lachnospiraceae bacterium]